VSAHAPVASKPRYPYLVVRIFVAFYQRERIDIRVGPPAVEFVNRRCFVQHPAPVEDDGTVSAACRAVLIEGVQAAVRRLPFRMCVVWSERDCTYVETDAIFESAQPPCGGVQPVELDFQQQRYEPGDPVPDRSSLGST